MLDKYLTFSNYAKESGYIGQEEALTTLDIYTPAILDGNNYSFLIQGESGQGKTLLTKKLIGYIMTLSGITVDNLTWQTAPALITEPDTRFAIYDEAHTIANWEVLYPCMEEHTTILITNYYDKIPEPVRNRCINIILSAYTMKELYEITLFYLDGVKLNPNFDIHKVLVYWLALWSRDTPRIIESNVERVRLQLSKPINNKQDLLNALGLNEDGMTNADIKYLVALKELNGRAGLKNLSAYSGLPEQYIIETIEPYLIKLNKITLTARGRVLNTKKSKIDIKL
jgi:hypothetical protein